MFISKAEKEQLVYRLAVLEQRVNDLMMKVVTLSKFPEARSDKTRKGREWTPEQRKAQSDRMKKQQAQARAKKEKV
jgi:hypothetical protein